LRYSILAILLFSFQVKAAVTAGLGVYSWQERILISSEIDGVSTNGSFSSIGPTIGVEGLLDTRYRGSLNFTYHTGVVDIIKKDSSNVSERFNYKSYWFGTKLLYRFTKSFAIGPNLVIGQKQIQTLPETASAGFFINLEYHLFAETKLIQSMGTMGDSSLLAYSFVLEKTF
jgi:hypothetical protein